MSGGQQIRIIFRGEVAALYCSYRRSDKVTGIINCCSNSRLRLSSWIRDHIKKKRKPIGFKSRVLSLPDMNQWNSGATNTKLKMAVEKG